MNKLFSKLSLGQRIILTICVFALPLAVLGAFVYQGFNKDVQFAAKEKLGNEYQRPLEELLKTIPQHQLLARRYLGGDKQIAGELLAKQAEVDKAFVALEAVQARLGVTLQFTDVALAQRKRDHARLASVKTAWNSLKIQLEKLPSQASDDQHTQLVADVRTMITHAGDMSNLILDPDLDSYYLMDVTLVALPQTQDRLGQVISFGEGLLARGQLTEKERLQFGVHAALLREADVERVKSDMQTSLQEDQNFYGTSESFQRDIPPALQDYAAASGAFVELLDRIADNQPVALVDFLAAGTKAREASFHLWDMSVNELDAMLTRRIDHYLQIEFHALVATIVAIIILFTA